MAGARFFGSSFFRAEQTGELLVRWVDDQGQQGQLRQTLQVQPPASRPAR
jgi:hypothetical protein